MSKFLTDGASLICTSGASSGSLKVLPASVKCCGKPMANVKDANPGANIPTFGACSSLNGANCAPKTKAWVSSSKTMVRGAPAVNEEGVCACGNGGKISPSSAGQSKCNNS